MGYGNFQNGSRTYRGNENEQRYNKSVTPSPVIIDSFYKEDKETILPFLFDTKAMEIAKSFVGKDRNGESIGVSSTQLRRIFDEVKRFEQILLSSSEQWNNQLPYIKMIKSKVAYSVARASNKKSSESEVYKNLEKFISSSIDLIETEQDYHVFVSLFEATYGFYYELAPKYCQEK